MQVVKPGLRSLPCLSPGSGVPCPAQSCLLSPWEEPLTQNTGPVGGVDAGLSQPVDIKPHEMLGTSGLGGCEEHWSPPRCSQAG